MSFVCGVQQEKRRSLVSVLRACVFFFFDVSDESYVCKVKAENVSSVCIGEVSVIDCNGESLSAFDVDEFEFLYVRLYFPVVLKGANVLYSSLFCEVL